MKDNMDNGQKINTENVANLVNLKKDDHFYTAEFNMGTDDKGNITDFWAVKEFVFHKYLKELNKQTTTVLCHDVNFPKHELKVDINSGYALSAEAAVAMTKESFNTVCERMNACKLDLKKA